MRKKKYKEHNQIPIKHTIDKRPFYKNCQTLGLLVLNETLNWVRILLHFKIDFIFFFSSRIFIFNHFQFFIEKYL